MGVASCKNHCEYNSVNLPYRAIPGGGYCWCDDGCEDDEVDSCCPDYAAQCGEAPDPGNQDILCMDARSHGSALGLFLANLRVTELYENWKREAAARVAKKFSRSMKWARG